ncbi:helix-turn-helix transcriptional regulator [Paenibacillus medicaginis]|uniref:AraC family transcriptional regulator n=1 Tax=Paenibacillus medicaginis TaxID=1470560 RepID=A0ABV5C226_9BACL
MKPQGLFRLKADSDGSRPVITAYYFKEWNEYEMALHTHPSTEIMYTIAGNCAVELVYGGETHREVLKKGEFIILDAHIPHRLLVEQSCRMLNVEFRFEELAGPYLSAAELAAADVQIASLLDCPQPYLLLREPHEVYHALKSLVLELDRKERSEMLVQVQLTALLLRIARLYHELESQSGDMQNQYVRQCLDFLHQNYDRPIQIKQVAEAVNLHPGYVQRIFKQKIGQSMMAYLTGFRMEKAKMLLRETDIPVAEIADYVGVHSRPYLHKLFKSATGMTPSDYRQSAEAVRFAHEQRGDDC